MSDFPQYRKYPNNKSFFKILSEEEFDEVHLQSDGWHVQKFKAKILPDRNLIADMLGNQGGHWETITENEYLTMANKCIS